MNYYCASFFSRQVSDIDVPLIGGQKDLKTMEEVTETRTNASGDGRIPPVVEEAIRNRRRSSRTEDGVLNWNTRLAYGTGHILNDLCASMWFIYLSYYLLYVVGLSENTSGLALLSG